MSIEIVKGFPVDADGRVRGEFTHNPSSLRLSMRDAFKAKVDELESLVQRLQVIGPDRVVEPSSNPCKLAEARSERDTLKEKVEQVYMAGRWSAPGVSSEEAVRLWTELRDEAGIKPGTATQAGVGEVNNIPTRIECLEEQAQTLRRIGADQRVIDLVDQLLHEAKGDQ